MKHIKTIKLEKTTGKKTIAESSDIFPGYIDSDFKKWNLNVPGEATEPMNLEVQEIEKDGTFKDFFTNPEKMVMTQEQIIEFCKNHKKDLSSWYTFFLFKVNNDFFVAFVYDDGRRLSASVREFSYDGVWRAARRYRIVFPQQDSETPSPESLSNLESLTLTRAIKICKNSGYQVSKIM